MSSFFPQSTFFGIDMMGSALQNFSVAENVTSDNIANINTPGASRQSVQFTEAPPIVESPFMATHVPGTVGDGNTIAEIQRIHSNADDSLFRGASSSQNYYTTEQNALQGLQSELGDPNSGVSAQFSSFQTAINQLVSQVGSGSPTASRANVLTAAQSLATSLGSSATAVNNAEAQTLSSGASIVTTVNGILDQIAALNGQIRASTAVGDSPNTFSDQRDYLIDQLSQYLSTDTSIQSDGSTLVTVNGQALVNDTVAYHLAAPVVGQAANGTPSFNVYFATTPTTAPSSPSIPLGSGQLAALQDLYNNKLSVYGAQLDQFASSLSNETNRITESSYDQNGAQGTALFQPIVTGLPISALNIKCGILDPSDLPVSLANTNAGTLVVPMNSANNSVNVTLPIDGNTNLANPPSAAGITGTLAVQVDGVTTNFNYNTSTGPPAGNASSVDAFVTNFNALQSGVTASFDTASQSIVFARDPNNESLALRGAQVLANTNTTAPFMITDTPTVVVPPVSGLLTVLGAGAISGVSQTSTNAFASSDNAGANAIVNMFQSNVGVPALEMVSAAAAPLGVLATVALPQGINNIAVGQVLTLDAQQGGATPANAQENVVVTSISVNPANGIESVSFTPAKAHAANYTIASAQVQTLQQFYGQTITQVGLDTQTAITGTTTQTALATSIDSQRQAISGINLDEETQNLIMYQNAYSAAARTISTLNTNLGVIINQLGVSSGS